MMRTGRSGQAPCARPADGRAAEGMMAAAASRERRPRVWRVMVQPSSRTLAMRATSRHLAISVRTKAANSSGVPGAGKAPMSIDALHHRRVPQHRHHIGIDPADDLGRRAGRARPARSSRRPRSPAITVSAMVGTSGSCGSAPRDGDGQRADPAGAGYAAGRRRRCRTSASRCRREVRHGRAAAAVGHDVDPRPGALQANSSAAMCCAVAGPAEASYAARLGLAMRDQPLDVPRREGRVHRDQHSGTMKIA